MENNNIENKTESVFPREIQSGQSGSVKVTSDLFEDLKQKVTPEFSPLTAVKKKLKDGSTKIYYYDQKQYYRDFKDKKTEKSECEICGQIIGYFSKSKHNKTMKHELALLRKKINEQSNKDILI
jgi:hypothetical protein